MRVEIFCVLVLVAFASAQMHVGTAWQGTWSDGKRSGGGSLYICVDSQNNVAYGAYSGIGVFSGFLKANTLSGSWHEAGYDRPFGPFQLTLSGSSFSGTWSYWESPGVVSNQTFSWSGSRSSNSPPTPAQCLRPNGGNTVDGTYTGAAICYVPATTYLNTYQSSVFATFDTFGQVAGYSPDDGHHVLLSDYYYPDDDETMDGRFRPGGDNQSTFGPCSGCFDDDGDADGVEIPTRRIVVGALIDDATFCGYFWKGLYNEAYNGGAPICFAKEHLEKADPFACGSEIIYINGQADRFGTGATTWLIGAVQDALDALRLPNGLVKDYITISGGVINTNSKSTATNSYTPGGQPNYQTTSDSSVLFASFALILISVFLTF